jgi:hypothetical protein
MTPLAEHQRQTRTQASAMLLGERPFRDTRAGWELRSAT